MSLKISEAIDRLQALKQKHGDITVQADCPFCVKTFDVDVAVIAPETVRLKDADGVTTRELISAAKGKP